jgi:LacI family transcriptional regulator
MSSTDQIPTLDDVAKEARVSTATVSRCLNKPDAVSEKTRIRVMNAVDLLGYTPNFGAQAMAAKRTSTIGAIIPTMDNAIFARGLQAFQEELLTKGYTLLVSSTAYQPETEAAQIKALIARGADGLLLIGYERDPEIYEFLRRRGVPTLVSWAYDATRNFPTSGFDNRASMYELADHVLSSGHKNIGIITGILKGNDRAAERLKGIQDALRAHGLNPNDSRVVETSYEIENGARAFEQLMGALNRPSVVMCGNDVLAVGAIQRAHDLGIRVPEDISITGFDDIELARIVTPKLTTVHVPHREMGLRAAKDLIRMVEKRSTGASTQLQSSLKLRGSLRPYE